jgi:hypothetical protein
MALATINSGATTKTLRSNLRELPTYCSTIKGDIELLHSYFDANYTQIIARGATVNDPVDILFSAYMVIPSSEVQNKMIIMVHQISSCHVLVVRSFFILKKMLLSS